MSASISPQMRHRKTIQLNSSSQFKQLTQPFRSPRQLAQRSQSLTTAIIILPKDQRTKRVSHQSVEVPQRQASTQVLHRISCLQSVLSPFIRRSRQQKRESIQRKINLRPQYLRRKSCECELCGKCTMFQKYAQHLTNKKSSPPPQSNFSSPVIQTNQISIQIPTRNSPTLSRQGLNKSKLNSLDEILETTIRDTPTLLQHAPYKQLIKSSSHCTQIFLQSRRRDLLVEKSKFANNNTTINVMKRIESQRTVICNSSSPTLPKISLQWMENQRLRLNKKQITSFNGASKQVAKRIENQIAHKQRLQTIC